MVLETIAKCIKVNKHSRSPAFQGLEIGDDIHFLCELSPAGMNSHGTCAKFVICRNGTTGNVSTLSFNQLDKILSNYEFAEYKKDFIPAE